MVEKFEKMHIKHLVNAWLLVQLLDLSRISQRSQVLDLGFTPSQVLFPLCDASTASGFPVPAKVHPAQSLGCGNWAFGLKQPQECEEGLGLRLGQWLSRDGEAVRPERRKRGRRVRCRVRS